MDTFLQNLFQFTKKVIDTPFFTRLSDFFKPDISVDDSVDLGTLKINDMPVRKIGFIVIFITFGLFGSWSVLAPIDSSAIASGVIAVKSHKKSVQHLDGGIVKKILVKTGDLVKAGDVLLKLDDTQTKSQLEISKGLYISLLAQQARLAAEREQNNDIDFPDLLGRFGDRESKAKELQQQMFVTRKMSNEGNISVLNQRIDQLKSKKNGLRSQQRSNKNLTRSFQEEINDLTSLLKEGFADRNRLREVKRNYTLKQGEIAQLSAEIASTKIQIGETKLKILQINKEFQENVASKLGDINTQLIDSEERMTALKDKVVRTEIRAPTSGLVMGITVHTEGGIIAPGEVILNIIPQGEGLIVDAQVSPMDIDRVFVGLLAQIRLSAFKQALTPVVEGKLITLSADRLIDESTGAPYFAAQVEITPESYEKLENFELLPGMPAEVLINTGERTVFEYLTQPISNAFSRGFIED